MAIVGSRDHLCVKGELSHLRGREKVEACSRGVKLSLKDREGRVDWAAMAEREANETRAATCSFYQEKSDTIELAIDKYMNTILDL